MCKHNATTGIVTVETKKRFLAACLRRLCGCESRRSSNLKGCASVWSSTSERNLNAIFERKIRTHSTPTQLTNSNSPQTMWFKLKLNTTQMSLPSLLISPFDSFSSSARRKVYPPSRGRRGNFGGATLQGDAALPEAQPLRPGAASPG